MSDEKKWTHAELCQLAERTGSEIAARQAEQARRTSAGWREREGRRLAREQAAPEMYEALREGNGDTFAGSLEALANGLVIAARTADAQWVEWLRNKAAQVRAALAKADHKAQKP